MPTVDNAGASPSVPQPRCPNWTTSGQNKARFGAGHLSQPKLYTFFADSPGSSSSFEAQRETLSMALAFASTASSAPGPEGEILNNAASVGTACE